MNTHMTENVICSQFSKILPPFVSRTAHSYKMLLTSILMTVVVACLTSVSAYAAEYYVDSAAGDDAHTGLSAAEPIKTLQKVSSLALAPGDAVYLRRGSTWNEGLDLQASGNSVKPIHINAYDAGSAPQVSYIDVQADYVTIANLLVDRNKDSADAVQVQGNHCTLKNLVVRNGTRDGIDIANSADILIESCLIHHFLNGTFSDQADAHGVVATGTQGLTIRNTEIHHVSGDSFQADPSRDPNNMSDNILIENCHFWTGPLTENFNTGWVKTSHLSEAEQQYPGENAIDTKVVKENWEAAPRMQLTMKNCTFHGWKQDGYISNKAALNLKEKIDVVIDSLSVYDSEIGFRLRGGLSNANVTIHNAIIYNCEYGVRTEDNLENLKIYDSTFGANIGTMLQPVASSSGFDTWDLADNAFLESKPSLASDPSNTIISQDDWTIILASSTDSNPLPMQELRLANSSNDGSDPHAHFNDMISALKSSGHLHFSSSMRDGADDGYTVDAYLRSTPANYTCYNSTIQGTEFYTENNYHDDIVFEFTDIKSGDVWIQYETYLGPEWADGTDDIGNTKFVRVRKDSIGSDGRMFDVQNNPQWVCKNDSSCPGGYMALRSYDTDPPGVDDSNPLKDPDNTYDHQPGGDTACIRPSPENFIADDHLANATAPFLYMPGKWIRVTIHLDIDNERVKMWASDEDNDTVLVIADPDNSDLGYYLNAKSSIGIDGMLFNNNLSSGDPDPKIRHWHRNLIIGHNLLEKEETLLLSGKPKQ